MKEEKVQTCSEREETRRRGLKRKGDKQEGKEGCNKRKEKAEQRERERGGERRSVATNILALPVLG